MNVSTRYQITGGVFLGSLLIIFVPMLFDEPSEYNVEVDAIESGYFVSGDPIEEPNVDNAIAQREALRELVDEDGFRLDTQTKVGEPAILYDTSQASAWAVQLGSFTSDEQAEVFRQELSENGLVTWVSHAKVNGEVWTRVATGPYHRLEEAEAVKEAAVSEHELEAAIVRFLP